jgi:hypothetical protein
MLKAMAEVEAAHPSIEPSEAYVKWVTSLYVWAFVLRRFSAEPALGEIGIENVLRMDVSFIVRWLGDACAGAGVGAQEKASGTVN